jgi:hypothetical protein
VAREVHSSFKSWFQLNNGLVKIPRSRFHATRATFAFVEAAG